MISRIAAEPARIKQAGWWEYPVRFVFGGVITAVVGILGKAYGPAVAGLFLAFPAILPAALTLISNHDGEKPAGVDSFGAAVGGIGLIAFALAVWGLSSRLAAWLVLLIACVLWAVVSLAAWVSLNKIRHPGLHIT
jgi:hypothetical protein